MDGGTLLQLRQESVRVTQILETGGRLCRDPRDAELSPLRNQLEVIKDLIYTNRCLAPLLDSFNQMGNIAFLRSQDRLGQTLAQKDAGDEMRRVYREYFESVETALAKVDKALNRLLASPLDLVSTSACISDQSAYTNSIGKADHAVGRRESAVP